MKKYILPSIIIVIVLIIMFSLWRLSIPNSIDPQPAECRQKPVMTHPASEQADQLLKVTLENDRGTGISVAVIIDGELVFANAYGTDGQETPLGTYALMRTGSVAKLFTAVAAARLIETNLIDMDKPVALTVPEFPDEEITAYQLGTHTSGIRHYNFGKMAEANNQVRYQSLSDALEIFSSDPILFEPGTDFNYSSYGYNLLGLLVERAYGKSYEIALHDLIAEPLGIDSLRIDDREAITPCRPTFNTIAFGLFRINAPSRDNSDLYPSGGLLISASDLATFVDATFNSDFLQPESVALFSTPVLLDDGTPTGYSFAWQIEESEDGSIEWYGHGGHINGAYASARYYPDSKMTIVGLTNYNYWLTKNRAEFYKTIREELPKLFDGS